MSRFGSTDRLQLPSYLTCFEIEHDVIWQPGLEVDPFRKLTFSSNIYLTQWWHLQKKHRQIVYKTNYPCSGRFHHIGNSFDMIQMNRRTTVSLLSHMLSSLNMMLYDTGTWSWSISKIRTSIKHIFNSMTASTIQHRQIVHKNNYPWYGWFRNIGYSFD